MRLTGMGSPGSRFWETQAAPFQYFFGMNQRTCSQLRSHERSVGANCGAAVTLASNAAVVVWSVGANASTGGAGAHEAQNPNPQGGSADRIFVSGERSDVAGSEFDDLITWISMPALLGRVLAAGHLP